MTVGELNVEALAAALCNPVPGSEHEKARWDEGGRYCAVHIREAIRVAGRYERQMAHDAS